MDPDECLKRIKTATAEFMVHGHPDDNGDLAPEQEAACEVIQAFEDLDEWLSKGGALPTKWSVNR